MSQASEADKREYIQLGRGDKHVHYDVRLDQYRLRRQVLRRAREVRKATGIDHLEAIPHRWEEDLNFSSITLRSSDAEHNVQKVYAIVPKGRSYRLRAEASQRTR